VVEATAIQGPDPTVEGIPVFRTHNTTQFLRNVLLKKCVSLFVGRSIEIVKSGVCRWWKRCVETARIADASDGSDQNRKEISPPLKHFPSLSDGSALFYVDSMCFPEFVEIIEHRAVSQYAGCKIFEAGIIKVASDFQQDTFTEICLGTVRLKTNPVFFFFSLLGIVKSMPTGA